MCTVCNGYPGCPVCTEVPDEVPCPECGGSGKERYYRYIEDNDDWEEVSQAIYDTLPDGERESDPCPYCQGSGVIFNTHDPYD